MRRLLICTERFYRSCCMETDRATEEEKRRKEEEAFKRMVEGTCYIGVPFGDHLQSLSSNML